MKFNIKHIFAAVLTVGALSSCEGMLDRFPQDSLSPETFFSNASELESFTNTFYTMLPGEGSYTERIDNLIGMELASELWGGRLVPESGGGWSWGTLRNINTMLEYSVNCKDEPVRAKYNALARFFRAYFYFDKVKRFGDVPWYETQLGSGDPELYKPRDSRELVMQKMIEDIDYAIENLPATKSEYTITKWTALAFKSRFCLFEGTFRKYHEGNDAVLGTLPEDAKPYTYYLEQSIAASEEFMASSGYGIYTSEGVSKDYIGLFTTDHVAGSAVTKEVILARDYNKGYGAYHNANYYVNTPSLGRPGITKKIVASYLMKDGSRYTDKAGWQTNSFVEETKNRDPRLAQSMRTPGYTRRGETQALAPDLSVSVTGYAPIKYVTEAVKDAYNSSDIDLILFRAAEVFLNFAEAKAELPSGHAQRLTQADLDRSVKLIRDRVGMPNINMAEVNANPDPYLMDKWTGYPKVAQKNADNVGVILEIRRERTIELLQEGHRYYDIIRWAEGHTFEGPLQGLYFPGEGTYDLDGNGSADVTLYKSEKPAGAAALALQIGTDVVLSDGDSGSVEPHKNARPGWTWNDGRDYYYPIPSGERNITKGALTQNPGWVDNLEF